MATPQKTAAQKKESRPAGDLFSAIPAPAKRTLAGKGISTVKQLARYSQTDILQLHGMGPGSMAKLKTILQSAGLSFKKADAEPQPQNLQILLR